MVRVWGLVIALFTSIANAYADELTISNVSAAPKLFKQGDSVTFRFTLNQAAKAAVNVYDARGYLVWQKGGRKTLKAGEHEVVWNGKGKRNKALWPEAYYYTVSATDKAGNTALYDLTDITGGERIYVQTINYDPETKQVTYMMPSHARVFLRYGLDEGPMLGTLVNSAVKPFGLNMVSWDGLDPSKKIILSEHGKIKFGASGYTLPRNALIYQGNGEQSAKLNGPTAWSKLPADERKQRESKPDRSRPVHIHRFQNREASKDFKINLSATAETNSQGLLIANDKSKFRVTIADEDRPFVEAQRFEVSFFINNKLVHENEVSYVPYTWHMPNLNLPKGEHLLTALVVGFGSHFGVSSVKFVVE